MVNYTFMGRDKVKHSILVHHPLRLEYVDFLSFIPSPFSSPRVVRYTMIEKEDGLLQRLNFTVQVAQLGGCFHVSQGCPYVKNLDKGANFCDKSFWHAQWDNIQKIPRLLVSRRRKFHDYAKEIVLASVFKPSRGPFFKCLVTPSFKNIQFQTQTQ